MLPYRSQLPASPRNGTFDARRPWRGLGKGERRALLVFGAFNPHRHPLRPKLLAAMNRSRALAPGRVMVGRVNDFRSLSAAAAHQSNATFCLCPAGDTPAFTQRMYVAMMNGCLPVRIDLYMRYPADPGGVESAYPYASQIDWSRVVVEISVNGGNRSLPDAKQKELLVRRGRDSLIAQVTRRGSPARPGSTARGLRASRGSSALPFRPSTSLHAHHHELGLRARTAV